MQRFYAKFVFILLSLEMAFSGETSKFEKSKDDLNVSVYVCMYNIYVNANTEMEDIYCNLKSVIMQ